VDSSELALFYIEEIAMPEPRMTNQARTGRYYVRIPQDNVVEIDGYIKESGMYRAHFLSNAVVVGAREMAPASQKSPVERASADERQRLIRQALEQLAPEQRQVLELAYFEGLSQAEIAARLGQPLGTVNVRMRMAMRNLTTSLSPHGLLTKEP
jgi:RNA polymerase sigma factor (sigma-70 family)